MKKVISTSAAMLIAAGGFATAQAADEPGVKFNGDARVRAIYRDDFDFGNSKDKAQRFLDSRIRLRMKATAASGAYAVGRIRLMDGFVQGNERDSASTVANGDGNVWADMAYIGIPFSDTFTLEGGKYRVSYGNAFLWDDLGVAGVRGIIKAGGFQINPFIEWHSEGRNSSIAIDKSEDNDAIRYGVHVGGNINDNWKAGFVAAYQSDDRTEFVVDADGKGQTFHQHEGWLGSVYFSGQEGAFGLSGEFAFMDGSLQGFNQDADDRHDKGFEGWGTDANDDGYGGFLQPSYTIDALTLALNVGFTKDGYIADPGFGFLMAGGDHPLTVINVGALGDWFWGGLIATYTVSDSLKVMGIAAYASVDGDSKTGLASLENAWELSARVTYSIMPGATFIWNIGMLTPSFEDPTVEDDAAFGTYGQIIVSF